MEFLSSNLNLTSNPVALVMQTPDSVAAGYNAANTSTFQMAQLPFAPDQGFHEYRFDWAPNRVTFFADGQWLQDLEWIYPVAPGHISVNHWSNGNSKWSQGPPAQDAVMTVQYVKAYFNTSDSVKNQDFEEGCGTGNGSACAIPDGYAPTAGNLSTFFMDRGMCGEKVAAKGNITPTSTMTEATMSTAESSVTTMSTLILSSTTGLFLSRTSANPSVSPSGLRNAGSSRADEYKEAKEIYYLMLVVIAAALWFF
jgi:beta-glucanase (GH16 family)